MVSVKYLGLYPVQVPDSVPIDGMNTVAEVMAWLIESAGLPEEFFWERHLVLLNGKRPDMEDLLSDGDLIQILSYSEGG